MKRIIEKYNHKFLKEDGTRKSCTAITVPFSELPEDCDLSSLDVTVTNVLYDNCSILVRGFDACGNIIKIKTPPLINFFLFKAFEQSNDNCISLLQKYRYEANCIKFKKEIGYDNTIA